MPMARVNQGGVGDPIGPDVRHKKKWNTLSLQFDSLFDFIVYKVGYADARHCEKE